MSAQWDPIGQPVRLMAVCKITGSLHTAGTTCWVAQPEEYLPRLKFGSTVECHSMTESLAWDVEFSDHMAAIAAI